MSDDGKISERAAALERELNGLRAIANDSELPALALQLKELNERADRLQAKVARLAAERAELRQMASALRAQRNERVKELVHMGAPVAALAEHAGMTTGTVRSCLEGEEDVEAPSEPEPTYAY